MTQSVGGTCATQLVSAALGVSKNDRTIDHAHALAAGDGLPNATCAMFGIVTTVELDSVCATSGPNEGAVWESYWAEMTRLGIELVVTSRTDRSTGGTFHAAQFWRMNGRFGALG